MESAGGATKGGEWTWRSSRDLFQPITSVQYSGLLVFLVLSAVDVGLSAFLIFVAGGYVEGNPVLAWASEGLFLFLVAGMVVKAIGTGLLALLVSFANRFFTRAGDAVVLAALGTTIAILLLITIGAAPTLLTAIGL
jgi:hypothetical protein